MSPRSIRCLSAVAPVLIAAALGACSKTPEVTAAPATASVGSAASDSTAGGASASSAGMASGSASGSTAANVSDVDVTEHVKTALHQSMMLQGINIAVATTNGDVRLNGVLDSQAQIDEALRLARAADGTHSIHDELTVKK